MAFDRRVIHTDAGRGADQPLSPPKGFAGKGHEYVQWLRRGWSCPRRRQYLQCIARMMRNPAVYRRPEIRGPYARQALQALQALERIAK
jgi:hypothetical protein